jgi:hypothetical protein
MQSCSGTRLLCSITHEQPNCGLLLGSNAFRFLHRAAKFVAFSSAPNPKFGKRTFVTVCLVALSHALYPHLAVAFGSGRRTYDAGVLISSDRDFQTRRHACHYSWSMTVFFPCQLEECHVFQVFLLILDSSKLLFRFLQRNRREELAKHAPELH